MDAGLTCGCAGGRGGTGGPSKSEHSDPAMERSDPKLGDVDRNWVAPGTFGFDDDGAGPRLRMVRVVTSEIELSPSDDDGEKTSSGGSG